MCVCVYVGYICESKRVSDNNNNNINNTRESWKFLLYYYYFDDNNNVHLTYNIVLFSAIVRPLYASYSRRTNVRFSLRSRLLLYTSLYISSSSFSYCS